MYDNLRVGGFSPFHDVHPWGFKYSLLYTTLHPQLPTLMIRTTPSGTAAICKSTKFFTRHMALAAYVAVEWKEITLVCLPMCCQNVTHTCTYATLRQQSTVISVNELSATVVIRL
jgi:hypothetical protein